MDVKIIPIIPKAGFWTVPAEGVVTKVLDGTARTAQGLLQGTTSSWKPPVGFSIDGTGVDSRTIGTSDLRFLWVDQGTRPHVEVAHGRAMALQMNYTAKSSRGNLSRRGGGGGSGVVFARRVYHPGISARHLSERVQGLVQPLMVYQMNAALARLASGSA